MSSTTTAERFPQPRASNFLGQKMHGQRKQGSMEGSISTFGRTNAASRQEVADGMAAVTETAVVDRVSPSEYRVTFTVTHRIVPNERVRDA